MPIPPARASEARAYTGRVWRMVEAQSRPSTMALVDTLAEQALLEELIEASKPALPPACAGLHYLLATPFRYPVSRRGSRFRRPFTPGVFYAAEAVETSAIETGFWQLLFLADAPAMPLPKRPIERHAFAVTVRAACLDLTAPPLDAARDTWTHPTDYAPCQDFAAAARAEGVHALRYESVRDPGRRANVAVLDCAAFASRMPEDEQTWWLFPRPAHLQLKCEFPSAAIEIPYSDFAADPRIAAWLASRGA